MRKCDKRHLGACTQGACRNSLPTAMHPRSPAKKFDKFRLVDFFIHCESNGISSRFSVYLITEGVYHQPQAASSFAMMIYNGKPLVICNSYGIDDIHASRRDVAQEFETLLKIAQNIFFIAFVHKTKTDHLGRFLFYLWLGVS